MLDITETSVTYAGGENQTVFPIPFPFLASSHLRAHVTDADGVSRALTAGTDYTINTISDGNGELILFADGLAKGWTLTIHRLVPITQDILFHNQGPNSPAAMETATDKLTMIAQQLDDRIDSCLVLPDGMSMDELNENLTQNAKQFAVLKQEIDSTKKDVEAKASKKHTHPVDDIGTLPESLASKVDTVTFTTALSKKADQSSLDAKADISQLEQKADRSQLENKADKAHSHQTAEIPGLDETLANKLDADDPRLEGLAKPAKHASSHFTGGEDAIHPEDIGTLPAPPADGKSYLAVAGGWVEYIPQSGGTEDGDEGIGTMDHSQLLNRDAADQHPQSSIQHLPADLAVIRTDIQELAESSASLTETVTKKADKAELPQLASPETDGLLSASDKGKLDGLTPLPSGSDTGTFLMNSGNDTPVWATPATAAGYLPVMSETQKGIARLASDAGLRLDAGGALGIQPDNLISKANIEGRLSGHDSRLTMLESDMTGLTPLPAKVASLEGSLENTGTQLTGVQSTLAGLDAMSSASDAPNDGKTYLRTKGNWVAHTESSGGSGGGGGGGGAIVGEIRLLPFRMFELPEHWYFCNGDRFPVASDQGEALYNLSTMMKYDWNITIDSGYICLPNLFTDGQGYFLRPANNSSQNPGEIQTDAMRNITGSFVFGPSFGLVLHSAAAGSTTLGGAFYSKGGSKGYGPNIFNHGSSSVGDLYFDTSRVVPTDNEFRPKNIGMSPAIYLGV